MTWKREAARQGYLDLFASALEGNHIHFPGRYIIGAEVLHTSVLLCHSKVETRSCSPILTKRREKPQSLFIPKY